MPGPTHAGGGGSIGKVILGGYGVCGLVRVSHHSVGRDLAAGIEVLGDRGLGRGDLPRVENLEVLGGGRCSQKFACQAAAVASVASQYHGRAPTRERCRHVFIGGP